MDVEAIADSTRDLLRELAAVSAEGEALRRELETAWALSEDDEDNRPTLIPDVGRYASSTSPLPPSVSVEIELELDPRDRDTLPA